MSKEDKEVIKNLISGNVTGIKGDAEDEYRTGNVNLTAENVGALSVDGTAKKATADGSGNNIAGTYATKEELELYDKTITTGAVANGETVTIYSITTQLHRKLLAIHFRGFSNIVSTVFYYNGNLYDGVDFTTPKTSIAYAQVTISVESVWEKTYVKITNGMTSGSATYAMRKIVDL